MANTGCEDYTNDSSPSPMSVITRQLAFASVNSTPCVNNIVSIFDDDQATPLASKNTIFRQKKVVFRRISKSKALKMSESVSTISSAIYDENANMEAPPLVNPQCFTLSESISPSSESSGFVDDFRSNENSWGTDSNSKSLNGMFNKRIPNDEGFASCDHEYNNRSLAKFYQSPELSASPVLSFGNNSSLHRTTSNDSDSSFLRRRSSVPVLANLVRQNSLTAEMSSGYFQRRNQLGLDSFNDMSSCYDNKTSTNSSPSRGKVTSSQLDDTTTEEEHKITPKRRKPCFHASGDTPLLPGGTIASPKSKPASRGKVLGCINSPVVNLTTKKPLGLLSGSSKLTDITNTLSRCHSISSTLDENKIASSISSRDTYFLSGDCKSRSVLPTIETTTGQGRQFEISCVSTATVAELIQGRFEHCVSDYTIVDCRYPYEFLGGHISNAINVYTHDQLLNMFFRKSQHSSNSRRHIRFTESEKKSIVIFHCEFSSKRAPTLAKFLRSVDRSSNFHQYPNLFFPEIYVMQGGYSDFYKRCPEMCSPHDYVKMFDDRYRDDLKCSEKICKKSKISCLHRVRSDQDDFSPAPLPSLRGIGSSAEFGSQSTTSSPSIRFIR